MSPFSPVCLSGWCCDHRSRHRAPITDTHTHTHTLPQTSSHSHTASSSITVWFCFCRPFSLSHYPAPQRFITMLITWIRGPAQRRLELNYKLRLISTPLFDTYVCVCVCVCVCVSAGAAELMVLMFCVSGSSLVSRPCVISLCVSALSCFPSAASSRTLIFYNSGFSLESTSSSAITVPSASA